MKLDEQVYTLNHQDKLKSATTIQLLFSKGSSLFVFPLKLIYLPIDDYSTRSRVLFGVTVPKRIHKKAYVRNLLKRRVREAYRKNKPCIQHNLQTSVSFAAMYILVDKEITSSTVIEKSMIQLNTRFSKIINQ